MTAPNTTPGPWGFSGVRYRRDAMDWLNVTAGERETLVATVLAPSFYEDGNAHLIAAAPDMYDALEELHLKAVVGTDAERHAALDQAWRALCKARGEAA